MERSKASLEAGANLIVAVALAAFLIGFGKAGLGPTAGPFVTVWLALALPADDAIGLQLPMLIVADWLAVGAHWRRWDRAILLRLLAAAAAGIATASLVLANISEPALRTIIAVAVLAFVGFYAWSRIPRSSGRISVRRAGPAGFFSGVASTLAHLGGPPVMTYLMTTNLKPRPLVATSAALFAAVNLLKVPAYFAAGLFDRELIAATWWTWFAIPVGVVAGRLLIERIDRTWFDRIALVLLTAGALMVLIT